MTLLLCDLADGKTGPPRARASEPVDIETLLQIVLAPGPRLPWARDDASDLSLDQGCTARPRRRPRVSWVEAEACAGMRFASPRPRRPRRSPGPAASCVLAAIRTLPPRTAAMVIACGREKIRPDWMPGVEPEQIVKRRPHRRCRNGKSPTYTIWTPCSPQMLDEVREAYRQWHRALALLAETLDGTLEGYRITGFAAPARPWENEYKKAG